ncbi:LysR substrate-binding domain-containing protein [Roseomonas sp. CAU 1739]|uniref:LysR family transcriptional regulator n=1 Tax=Roseomonas sp. CAU 1739 TaxID=3140364 RepID=UPI00325BFCBE
MDMHRPNSRQLEAFRAVLMAGGMSAGARLLNITQPAASRLIRDLEAGLELTLFERRNGRLVVTQEGRGLQGVVERHVATLAEVLETARGLRASRLGQLRIAAGASLSLEMLPALLAALLRDYPRDSVRIATATARDVAGLVARGEADIGFAADVSADAAANPGVEVEHLPGPEAVCALPPGHRLARRRRIALAELHDEMFVSFGGDGVFPIRIATALQAAGVVPRIRMVASNAAMAARAVAQGIGLAILDPFTGDMLATQRLTVRPIEPPLPYDLALFRPLGGSTSPLAEAFATLVTAAVTQRAGGQPGTAASHAESRCP